MKTSTLTKSILVFTALLCASPSYATAIQNLSSRFIARIYSASGTNYGNNDYKLDLGECEVISERRDHSGEFESVQNLDCTDAFERTFETPLMHPLHIRDVYYRKDITSGREYHSTRYFHCSVARVEQVADKAKLDSGASIGFWTSTDGGSEKSILTEQLKILRADTTRSGREVYVVEFNFVSQCWTGSMTGSSRWRFAYKAFLEHQNGYREWAPGEDMRLHRNFEDFDFTEAVF